jgi:regulator of sigma E protease
MAPIFVLAVVVFIHELGHFLVARWCGVKVSTFSIGFGREIVGFNDKHGTRWKLGWIPLGGYVKFMDDENAASAPSQAAISQMSEEDRKGAFHLKPLWQRAAVVVAGPMANFLSAILMFALVVSIYGKQVIPAIIDVLPDNPAAAAGFKSGDVITKVGGSSVADFAQFSAFVAQYPGRPVDIEVTRDGAAKVITVTPKEVTRPDGFGGNETRGIIGVKLAADLKKIPVTYPNPLQALSYGVEQTWMVITTTLGYLADVVRGIQKPDKLGGLPTIIDVSNQMATYGIGPLVQLIALISVSIGLINLFPIPLLDGGHLMYYAAEAIRGRPLSPATQEIGFRIGLALVSMLMVFALWNDRFRIMRWFS